MNTLYNIPKKMFTILLFLLGAALYVVMWCINLALGSMNDRLEADIAATKVEWFDKSYDGSFGRYN